MNIKFIIIVLENHIALFPKLLKYFNKNKKKKKVILIGNIELLKTIK